MLVIAIFIIAFFFFFGCAYELVNYYLTDQPEEEEENERVAINNYQHRYIQNNINNNSSHQPYVNPNDCNIIVSKSKTQAKQEEGCTTKKIIISCLLAVLGIFLQPLYLLFYILIGMMECYRRFACWYFYF
jgi:hypothetical protein